MKGGGCCRWACVPRPAGCDWCPGPLPGAFPYLPGQSGYNKRLRAALPLLQRLIRVLATDTDLWTDPVWLVEWAVQGRQRLLPERLRH